METNVALETLNSKLTKAFLFNIFNNIFIFFRFSYIIFGPMENGRKNKNKVFIFYSKPISFIFNLYLRISKFLSNSIHIVSLYLIFLDFLYFYSLLLSYKDNLLCSSHIFTS